MARINVEQKALSDPRFTALASLLHLEHPDTAIGRMVRVWNECIERSTYILPTWVIGAIFQDNDASRVLVDVELAEWVDDVTIRIKGTEGRTEYLGELRASKVKGGIARAAGAVRDPKTGTFTSTTQQKTSSPPAESSAPAPAPAPAPAFSPTPEEEKAKNIVGLSADSCTIRYTDEFSAAWQAYPHHGTRSKKRDAFKVWKRDKLDKIGPAVQAWIEAAKQTDDWQRENGQYIPGMQAWLNGKDFNDDPPEQNVGVHLTDKTRKNLAVAQRFQDRRTP